MAAKATTLHGRTYQLNRARLTTAERYSRSLFLFRP
jgi:hypothetical protein